MVTAPNWAINRQQKSGSSRKAMQIIVSVDAVRNTLIASFYTARRKIEDADLLIVNHHLYFPDLSLRDEHAESSHLTEFVIFDEAHGLEEIASNHLGVSISEAQIRYFLQGLWQPE